ncbi:MAG TPA: NAD-dependent succinate-semialdehyde dehydrogenase [Acidimicrobiia bacterium]|jgi:succinate-semialdehyde dehydrogenase/glutarate-semialdehyde dehydrogenase|nr:NAD-dependent succinate-semialdehyde dehydrogenase [Acidimicrobiia bacterium]
MISSVSPTDGRVLAEYEETPAAEVDHHIATAAALQEEWETVSIADRAVPMRVLADLLERDREKLAVLMADEMGKPLAQGLAEVDKCAWVCRHYADEAERILADMPIPTERAKSYVAYRPLGVVLAVMPWNFPYWQVFRFLAPALMAGNAGILKHASNVTGCALSIDELVVEAGFPDGIFRTLVLPSSRVDSVLENPLVRAATLTGSDPAGRAVAQKAGSLLKKTVLELGGSDPYIVLADADIDLAARTCASSRLINGGQSCIAAKRFIVEEPVYDEFVEKMAAHLAEAVMGDPHDPATTLGPMARVDLRDELADQVERTVAAGGRLVLGGEVPEGEGAFYPPTLIADVDSSMPLYREETFGPVAAVIKASDLDDAVRIANDSDFGLGAAIFTSDVELGERVARDRLQAGACFVNALVASDPRLPFGGIKMSGYGRELADFGMREFLNIKTVVVG